MKPVLNPVVLDAPQVLVYQCDRPSRQPTGPPLILSELVSPWSGLSTRSLQYPYMSGEYRFLNHLNKC